MRSEQPHEITDAAIEGIAAMQTIALCKEDIKKYLAGELCWISEKTMQRGIKAVRGVLKQIEEPRFVAGQQCYVRNNSLPDYRQHDFNVWGMVISGPFFKELRNGVDVFYDVLVDGKVKNIRCKSIRKRR